MIDFEYWIANIVGACDLIASDEAFRKVWVDGDHTLTSIHYYDELYVQLTDGLRINELIEEFSPRLSNQETLRMLREFAASLLALDRSIENSRNLEDPAALLSSPQWKMFKESAQRVINLPDFQPYRGGRKNAQILKRLAEEEITAKGTT
jgi:hypothetical protein